METGLGWDIDTRGGTEIISKGGAPAGYITFIGYSPKTRVGVVALANTSAGEATTDIGQHLLDARYPLWVAESSPSSERTLETKKSRRRPNHLRDGLTRAANTLILHRGGRDQKAKRIDDAVAKKPEDTLAQRFEDQKAFPGSEAQVRVEIELMQRNQPTYERITPEFAEVARPQADSLDWRILLDAEGKVAGEGCAPSLTRVRQPVTSSRASERKRYPSKLCFPVSFR